MFNMQRPENMCKQMVIQKEKKVTVLTNGNIARSKS